jgi:hypothetical protein
MRSLCRFVYSQDKSTRSLESILSAVAVLGFRFEQILSAPTYLFLTKFCKYNAIRREGDGAAPGKDFHQVIVVVRCARGQVFAWSGFSGINQFRDSHANDERPIFTLTG